LPGADSYDNLKAEELAELARQIRERVRARHPEGMVGNLVLPDLMPVVRARDAAEGKVAAIGTVNPRPPGLVNNLIQFVKKTVARLLDWHVREQVEFNRAVINAIEAVLGALDENNRALARLAQMQTDVGRHWAEWRQEWEKKLAANEVQFLRSVADLEGAFQHRVSLMEANFRDLTRTQHKDFTLALEKATIDIQKRLWSDLEKVRADYERLINSELRLLRQRSALPALLRPHEGASAAAAPATSDGGIDFLWFAERFRGTEESVRERQRFYLPFFKDCRQVLDLGCGRGEFLELLGEAGIPARGVDSSEECAAWCRSKGLDVVCQDLFEHLRSVPDGSLDGISAFQLIEHLPPHRLPELIRLAASKLCRGGLLAIETPNPECLAALAMYFYLDPTHQRPVPAELTRFYMEECGFGDIEVHRLSPALEFAPSLAALPEDFRKDFFGGLDYAIIGRKLQSSY